ncbi:uncharacterized protein G2W53_003815 [Senna tora]|uniref:Uncharacterized protein n=1 Tax=Senna tora TaxID=362788 RepID=A0A835CJL5_9FABA|nr:uncharacterized protein G2W53_003815 [Senna tora]
MTAHTFYAVTSPIRALNALGFQNTTRSDRFDLYFLKSLEIQTRILVQNVFRHDFTLLPRDHESNSSIKSSWNPKYNAK